MKTTPNMGPPESIEDQAIAIALHDGKTIVGHGRRQHGLNGKDADLDYGGQCAVKSIYVVDGTSKDKTMFLEIEVNRYANICEPEEESLRDLATEIVCGADEYEGEWTGSDYWTFWHNETIRVPLTVDEHDTGATKENIALLADRCAEAIRKAPGSAFEQWAANLAKEVGNLSNP